MDDRRVRGRGCRVGTILLIAVGLAGCQNQGSGKPVSVPARIVIWEDPGAGGQGQTIRDANNDENRYVVIGTDGTVQFFPDETVCNDCEANIDEAQIDLGNGDLIDLRFGVGATGDDVRRLFLVDVASGNFVQLLGGGEEDVTFQVTTEPLEEPNDDSDDRAIAVGDGPNPTASDSSSSRTTLCGAVGLGTLGPMFLALLVPMWRRR